ncbi:MAG: gliding motility protein GldN [Saprospiraceae bacterium]|nr:gliding motility protein GldN [Saprospiraceae bacterium]
MKIILKFCFVFLLGALYVASPLMAQVPETMQTETSEPDDDRPLDDIVEKRIIDDRRVLAYQPLREADIFWEKRIWRIVDIREKMNLPFAYPEMPFFSILMDAAINGDITVYSAEDDKFSSKLDASEVSTMGASVDTVTTFDPDTYEETIQVVRNELNPEDIKRFRIKEVWFFDEETSTLQVRILGIAPLQDVKDDNGNFLYELPMFWVYYPETREVLARHKVFMENNDASPITWEDLMEMRFFSSYIYKESNVYDRRLKDYLVGVDLLLEADKIKQEIFNFEHDLWSY